MDVDSNYVSGKCITLQISNLNTKICSSRIVDPLLSNYMTLNIMQSEGISKMENIGIKSKERTRTQITKERAKIIRSRYPKIKKYNSTNFIERSKLIHIDQFDYFEIKDGDVINKSSKVILICTFCNYRFVQMVQNNIMGHGCKDCLGYVPLDP